MIVNWEALEMKGLWACETAARSVARSFPTLDEDDLFQEACLIFATHPDEMETQWRWGMDTSAGDERKAQRALARQVTQRLKRWADSEMNRGGRSLLAAIEMEETFDPDDATAYEQALMDLPYSPRMVESLLPVVWIPEFMWLPSNAGRVEGMPKAQSNPSHAGSHMVACIDLLDAWPRLDLPTEITAALFARFGLGATFTEAAQLLDTGVDAQRYRVQTGVEHIVTYLNGDTNA